MDPNGANLGDVTIRTGKDHSTVIMSSAVMFVSELERSVRFYERLLQVPARLVTGTAALLETPQHQQLYLRAVGDRAVHPLGAVGIQYLIWTAADLEDLARCEAILRGQSSRVTRTTVDEIDLLEGVGPDGVPILVTFPGPEQVRSIKIIPRVYRW
ncbi:VOC family protein [Curtobacterium flaccumfaciens]|uniref:VOC family protein n=1 Tax=Curtobacterium flaccumfaciens TaxID=2035 RepID=UPI001E46082D|nr:VOC family protein [Curtobacterium flaccumfaciens]